MSGMAFVDDCPGGDGGDNDNSDDNSDDERGVGFLGSYLGGRHGRMLGAGRGAWDAALFETKFDLAQAKDLAELEDFFASDLAIVDKSAVFGFKIPYVNLFALKKDLTVMA
jgi:hypothetical protein